MCIYIILMDKIPKKTCVKCGEAKPESEYYFYKNSKDKLYPYCRKCCRLYSAKYREKKIPKKQKIRTRKKSGDKSRHYIPVGHLDALVKKYTEDGSCATELAQAFYLMARKIIFFADEHTHEETIQSAVVHCWLNLPKYDRSRKCAFSFFTTVIINQHKNLYKKDKLRESRNAQMYAEQKHRFFAQFAGGEELDESF